MFERDTLPIIGDGENKYESAVTPPIFQTSTFDGGQEYSYTRVSNPTRALLEKEIAKLEGGKAAFAFSSGLGAINAVFSLLAKGDRVVVSDDLYGGTYRMITKIYEKYGIDFDFVDLTDMSSFEKSMSKETKMVFAETPTNPMMKIAPLADIAELCRCKNAIFTVDNTFLTPYFQNPLEMGADIVVHSATKFLSGHHDTVAGAVVCKNEALCEKMRMISMTLGNALSPFDSWLTLRGMRTLPLRMVKHEQNALAAAEFLCSRPEIENVFYPGLPEHSGHELCKKQARGFGGVVSFTVKKQETAKRLLNGGKLIKFAESLGGFRSLITYPLTQTHASIPKELRDKIGITDRLFRLSVGLEAEGDIINDLAMMLKG